jgi:hypothetical protein
MPCAPDLAPRDLTVPDLRACSSPDPAACARDYRDQHKLDRVVRFLNAVLLELECLRARRAPSSARWKASRALFHRALAFLWKRADFASDAVLWERLHALSTTYYPALNAKYRLGRIPVISVVMHNRAVAWWLRHRQPPAVGLLHVDSHIDMNDMHTQGLAAAGTRALRNPGALDGLVWDIGAVVTAYLLLHGPRSVVWLYPRWIPLRAVWRAPLELDGTGARSAYGSERHRELRHAMGPGPARGRGLRFSYSQTRGETQKQWCALARELGPQFILDVDLDYFVTNGVQTADHTDMERRSPQRVGRCNLTQAPRYRFDDTREMRRRSTAMQREHRAIDRRLDTFLRGLRHARQCGSVPVLISLSDSSSIISGLHAGVSWNNDYLPAQWALYVRTRLLRGLHAIYAKDGVALPPFG